MSVPDDVRLGHGHGGSVDVTVTDSVSVITLRCGENRFNSTFVRRLNEALDRVESDPQVHALVMIGEGRFFSTGLDLPWINHLGHNKHFEELNSFFTSFRSVIARILTFPMPTVAVLNGHAAAGGALLSLAFDVRVMRKDRGYFYLNEVRIGLQMQGFFRELTMCKIPNGRALTDAVILGRRLTGPDTLRLGITSTLCEQSELLQTGRQVAAGILSEGPYMRQAMKNNKESVYANVLVQDELNMEDNLSRFTNALAKSKM